MKISLSAHSSVLTATIFENSSARDFLTLLPLDLKMEDYASNEKIGYLPRKLTTEGSGPYGNEAIGDLAYYAPWGNLIIYYGPYRYSKGLIRLGTLDEDCAPLLQDGAFDLRINQFPPPSSGLR